MVHVSDSIVVSTPVETVFETLDDPETHATISPSITDIRNIKPRDNGGKELTYTYRLAGVPIDGRLVQTAYDPPTQHVFALEEGLTGAITLDLEPTEDGTKITYSAEYAVPGRVIARVIEPMVRWYNERELQSTLENLETLLAEQQQPTAE